MLSHPFFSKVNIQGILNREVDAPYLPETFEANEDTSKKMTEITESLIPKDKQATVDNADFKDFS